MSAESPRKAYKYTCNMVRPQAYSEKSLMESVVDFFNDVVPQAYTGSHRVDDKEKIQWVRFEDCDSNDIAKNPDLFKSDTKGLPLLLILGYSNGVQIWYITPNGEAQEIMSIRQGPVRLFRILPTPDTVLGYSDSYYMKRPLAVMCDSSSAGQPYCSIKFVSLKTGDEVHCINYKTIPVQNVECNKRFLVTVFHEKVCVYESCQFKQLFWITSCYPCPGQKVNPIALSTRWLAYADKRLVPMHQSCGGMSGDGAQSYAATVISAAKGAFKGLSMFGETVGSYVTGNKAYTAKKVDPGIVDNGDRPGIVSVVDLQNIHTEHFNVNEDNEGDGLIAHFHAHANEPVANMAFDSSGTLLVTACKLGHNFHVFRLMAHPCSSSLGAVHHLYTLYRGDTTAKVTDIGFNHDSRWVTVSTHRGTTHLFPITPYGGSVNVRTHCQPHVVNRASRFHKSAGLDEIEHNPVGRRSPVLSSSPGSSGQYDRYPSLIQQNTLNNNMGNPRLPPYPHPINVYPSYQIKQPLNISMNPGTKNASPTHSPTGVDNIFSVAAKFSTPRMCVVGSPKVGMERRETGKRPVDSLFILAQSGTLVEYILEPRARPSSEKVTDESQLDLGVTGRVQWNLQRQKNSPEQRPPLPSNSPLILAREAVATGIPTAPDLFDLPGLTRHESKESLSSDHSGKDDSDEQWVSQVEIITHAGPHRRLWMGPQFSFKTYQNTTVLSSNSSALLSQSPESAMAAMDIAGDEGDLESLKLQPARSNPVSMPTARPAYRRLSGSDSSPTPSKGGHATPLLIEAGSYEQSPHLCDVYTNWTESTVAKQPHLSDDLEEDQLKETLADAMVESPVKDQGKGIIKQEISRSESTKSEVEKGAPKTEVQVEKEGNKKQKGKKKKQGSGKNEKQAEKNENDEGAIGQSKSKESVKCESKESVKSQSKESVKSQSKESVKSQSKESVQSQSKESVQSQSKESVKSQSKDSVKSQIKESVKDQSKESVKSQSKESLKSQSQNKESVKPVKEKPKESKENETRGKETDQTQENKQENIKIHKDDIEKIKEKKLLTIEKDPSKKGYKTKGKSDNKTDDKGEKGKGSENTDVSSAALDASVEAAASRSSEDKDNTCEIVTVVKLETDKSNSKTDSETQESKDKSNSNFKEIDDDQAWSTTGKKKNKSQRRAPKESEVVTPSESNEETDMNLSSISPQKGESHSSLKEAGEVHSAAIRNSSQNPSTSIDNKIKSEGSDTENEISNDVKQKQKSLFENVRDDKKEVESVKRKEKYKESEIEIETSKPAVSRSENAVVNPWKMKLPESITQSKSKSSASNVTLKSESKEENDEITENLIATDDYFGASNNMQENTNRQSADKYDCDEKNEMDSVTEESKDALDIGACASFTDKTESNKETLDMEESMYESIMEMSVAELPTNTVSEEKLANKEEKEAPQQTGGKNKKKKRKNKKNGRFVSDLVGNPEDRFSRVEAQDITIDRYDLFGGDNDNISISSGSSAGMVMNRQAEQLLDNVFSMAGESTDSN